MEKMLHELFRVADDVEALMGFNDDGELYIVDERGNKIEVDDAVSHFLIGVHTLTEIIQEM